MLYYVDKLEDEQPKGMIPIVNIQVSAIQDDEVRKQINVFELHAQPGRNGEVRGIKRAQCFVFGNVQKNFNYPLRNFKSKAMELHYASTRMA